MKVVKTKNGIYYDSESWSTKCGECKTKIVVFGSDLQDVDNVLCGSCYDVVFGK